MARQARRDATRLSAAPRVCDLLAAVDAIAPLRLAAEWDNVGLVAGAEEWPARRVLLAIDLTDAVAREALSSRVSAVLAYHPPIFKGTKSITRSASASTSMLAELLAAKVSILSVHTALDAAVGGTNDVLLDSFDVRERRPLEVVRLDATEYKLVVFAPAGIVDRLRGVLSDAGAGVIGQYSHCSYALAGRGTFFGSETTNPTIGRAGRLEFVEETRLEMVAPAARLGQIVRALYAAHTYEEPAFDLYPLSTVAGRGQVGMGRVGALRRRTRGDALLRRLRSRADLSVATVVGDLRRSFDSITAAAGSFGVRSFRDPRSLVLTGEFKHHDALELLSRGVTAIALGHYASERPALENLRTRLQDALRGAAFRIALADQSPFRPVAGF